MASRPMPKSILLTILIGASFVITASWLYYLPSNSVCLRELPAQISNIQLQSMGKNLFSLQWDTDKDTHGTIFVIERQKGGEEKLVQSFSSTDDGLSRLSKHHSIVIQGILQPDRDYVFQIFSHFPCEDKIVGYTSITSMEELRWPPEP